jgi:protein tyrosine/serine phosphatase
MWAQPLLVEGVPNLHIVSTNLYRSAQPNRIGMQNLEKLGVKTVINLRSFNSDRSELKGTKLQRAHIYMKAWHPEHKEVLEFLRIATDTNRTPVLVHCQHGADRTGTMCAIYRIVVQGWTKEDALREMQEGGFGYHAIWKNLPSWISKLDVESIRSELGIKTEPL